VTILITSLANTGVLLSLGQWSIPLKKGRGRGMVRIIGEGMLEKRNSIKPQYSRKRGKRWKSLHPAIYLWSWGRDPSKMYGVGEGGGCRGPFSTRGGEEEERDDAFCKEKKNHIIQFHFQNEGGDDSTRFYPERGGRRGERERRNLKYQNGPEPYCIILITIRCKPERNAKMKPTTITTGEEGEEKREKKKKVAVYTFGLTGKDKTCLMLPQSEERGVNKDVREGGKGRNVFQI